MSFQFRDFPIIGQGGGGKKGGGNDAENTLRSKARAQLVELICEGPIKGLVNSNKSIFLGETAIANENGTENYKNVVWRLNRGLPDDNYFAGNTAAQTPYTVDVQVKKNTGEVIRSVIDENVDAVKVVIRIPALFKAKKKDGTIQTTSLSYRIKYRAYNGSWVVAHTEKITDEKTTSVYQKQHMIKLPDEGAPWDISVERLTDDSDDDKLSNELWWESYYTVVNGKFVYPNTAALYLEVNAEDVGSSVPTRAVEIYGMIIKVPANYDPETRTYTGIWNGAFKYAYSNNPAWVFYDLVTNSRYGLGEFVDEAKVDKWSLYQIAQYCDQKVDTGFVDANGNRTREPRYTFNGVINSRQEAFNVLRQIATAWRGMAYWSLGQVYATSDMPTDPVALLTPSNVINGEFEYSGVALKATHSVALVSYNDPNDFYRPAVEVVINEEMLRKYGWREKTVTLVGCTSRGLAHRYGKWILDTEQNEDQTVTYRASWDQIAVRPGDIVAIADPNKAEIRHGGRLASCTATSAQLDAPFKPIAGNTYSIMMVQPSGKIISKPITSFAGSVGADGYKQVNFTSVGTDVPQTGAQWVILGNDINPRRYRILSVREEKPNEFRFNALFHDPTKYARVENGIILQPPVYRRPQNYVAAPTNLSVRESRNLVKGNVRSVLLLSWSMENDYKVKDYIITLDHPIRGKNISVGTTSSMSIEADATVPGVYTFHVKARGVAGNFSEEASFSYEVVDAPLTALPVVDNLVLAESPGNFAFRGTDIRIRWENYFATSTDPTSDDGKAVTRNASLYKLNRIKVYNTDTNELLRDQTVTQEAFTYSFQMNVADNQLYNRGPARNVTFKVSVVDIYDRESLPASISVTNPPPGKIAISVKTVGQVAFLSWPLPTETDFVGTVVHASKTQNFTPDQTTLRFEGMGNAASFELPTQGIWFIKGAAFDRFGQSGIVYSDEVQVVTGSLVDIDPPETPTGLAVTSSLINGRARVVIAWTANTEGDLAGYDLLIKQGNGNFVSVPVASGPYEFDSLPGVTYEIKIRARDINGNSSPYSAVVAHTAIVDTVPPAVPTSVVVAAGLTSLWLSWVNPADEDLDYIEILESATNDPQTAVVVASTIGTSFARTGLANNVKRYYWLRAVDTSGNKSAMTAAASATTAELPQPTTYQFLNLLLKPNTPSANQVSWDAFTAVYGLPGSPPTTKAIVAGSFPWTAGSVYIYYVEGETVLRSASTVATVYSNRGYLIAVYRGGNDLQMADGKVVIDGANIAAGTIGANQLVANSAIITGTAQIADAVITSAKIVELDAAKIKAGSVLSDTIQVGGDTLKTIKDRAADPASRVNQGTTQINPGKITISGSITLADWRAGGDTTQINGGAIYANSIKANSLEIGLRAITTIGVTFEPNSPAVNQVSWTAGSIGYTGDDGVAAAVAIAAGDATFTTATLYIYWTKGATTLSSSTSFSTANAEGNVVLAVYRGGANLNANYGRTIIDGSGIKTGTITADQIKTASLTADLMNVTNLAAISANFGTVTAGVAMSSDGKMRVDLTNKRILIAD